MFQHKKVSYYMPLILILKSLMNVSDKFIYNALTSGCDNNVYYQSCVLNMLRTSHEQNVHTHEQCKSLIGNMFRIKLHELPSHFTDSEVCDYIIK